MTLAFNGLQAVAFNLLMEREGGTLLRAKAAPNGMVAYLISKILHASAMSLITIALTSPRNIGVVMFPLLALFGISGIFFPMTEGPEWLQWIAQVFPVYWLGLGMRAALLPDQFAALELGESWRHLETFAVLGVWSAIGLSLAPMVLHRMARKESGSVISERQKKAMQ